MSRLRARMLAVDTAGNVMGSATINFYAPGTASLVGTENCVIVCILTRVKDGQGRPTTTFELRKRKIRVNVEHGNVMKLIGSATAAYSAQ